MSSKDYNKRGIRQSSIRVYDYNKRPSGVVCEKGHVGMIFLVGWCGVMGCGRTWVKWVFQGQPVDAQKCLE